MQNTLELNHLPVLTWNKLKMNSGKLTGADALFAAAAEPEETLSDLPQGVSCRSVSREAAARLLAAAPKQEAERVVAGKVPAYHPQTFATGLGQEYDERLASVCSRVRLMEVGAGVSIEEPVFWSMGFPDGKHAVTEQMIHVGAGASLTLIMDFRSGPAASGFAGVSTKIILEKEAKLNLSRVQMLGGGFVHADDLGVSLAERSALTLNQMELGGQKSFVGAQAEMIGNESAFCVRACYLTLGGEEADMNYNAVQRGRKTDCRMSFDGVLGGRAKKTLRGTIDFRGGSAGSVGDEQENVLLLSNDIENKSIPMILCEEEDVEGRHGATIGRLDEGLLFYLGTRGIDARAAQEMMVYARLGTVAREIHGEELQRQINDYIRSRL
ncbi:SufB/SufD family protein [Lachnoclostridium sp. Marseille-P6806]|uniref:SufB/SufD family protein n=1 Tax=Lachnoclostridium sp. Marseille-P6806 TaxID=2364793 RepID=UPI00102F71AC|nr:SufD family Fe-S cluster assembly protein [Lachnoclostridium sp. Marseille-P6806]